ncbi:DEAD-box ATP-dependent RNA helicase 39-like [Pistacia vera]|uniref:DEAD-box ATP-dependent RNA helicase 39-like n=1 Tax=Pistacia vera TaxID=55513 RepID=UPI001263D1BA|nr:DEAD-box ATP-dependent RNA helicase 39-like [Pistacia vera]
MKTRTKSLVFNLSKLLSSIKPPFLSLRPLSSTTNPTEQAPLPSKPSTDNKDSFILESFRLRQLKSSLKNNPQQQNKTPEPASSNAAPSEVVSSFEELGLKEEVIKAVEGLLGVFVPSEIQCVGIPAVLDGKSIVLSSGSGSGRTLAYLLPLVQMLRREEALFSMKPKHPRAIVLCTTEESADEGFRVAKFISHYARLKSSMENGGDSSKAPEDVSNAPIGILVGTPREVLQYVEDGSILCNDVKYLVLDEADTLFEHGFGPEISKILSPLKDCASKSSNQEFQTILVTSTISEMLGKQGSSLMERLEHDVAGKVTAMLIEMEQEETFDLIESPNALKKKVAEAVNSLNLDASGS